MLICLSLFVFFAMDRDRNFLQLFTNSDDEAILALMDVYSRYADDERDHRVQLLRSVCPNALVVECKDRFETIKGGILKGTLDYIWGCGALKRVGSIVYMSHLAQLELNKRSKKTFDACIKAEKTRLCLLMRSRIPSRGESLTEIRILHDVVNINSIKLHRRWRKEKALRKHLMMTEKDAKDEEFPQKLTRKEIKIAYGFKKGLPYPTLGGYNTKKELRRLKNKKECTRSTMLLIDEIPQCRKRLNAISY